MVCGGKIRNYVVEIGDFMDLGKNNWVRVSTSGEPMPTSSESVKKGFQTLPNHTKGLISLVFINFNSYLQDLFIGNP